MLLVELLDSANEEIHVKLFTRQFCIDNLRRVSVKLCGLLMNILHLNIKTNTEQIELVIHDSKPYSYLRYGFTYW